MSILMIRHCGTYITEIHIFSLFVLIFFSKNSFLCYYCLFVCYKVIIIIISLEVVACYPRHEKKVNCGIFRLFIFVCLFSFTRQRSKNSNVSIIEVNNYFFWLPNFLVVSLSWLIRTLSKKLIYSVKI